MKELQILLAVLQEPTAEAANNHLRRYFISLSVKAYAQMSRVIELFYAE